ncbi:heparin lyase I family protein [Candidatus Bathyarchaeota archaeon]|nr:heparin lyase I family protein [Candidatus Bathyarchaeota archaeon]
MPMSSGFKNAQASSGRLKTATNPKICIAMCLLLLSLTIGPSVPKPASAAPLLTLKWHIKLPSSYGHFHPCMGDVDKDGVQEIVVVFGSCVYVLNGKTGAIKWKSPYDAAGTVVELADLNRDGTPEIVYCGSGLSVYARDGFGNLLWKSSSVSRSSGEFWPGTPIVTGDTDHNGYPEIYVVTADTTEPYTGCITKLDHTGKILARSEICYKPCWGGLALADADFDGKFEIYLGDRASRGGPGGSSNPYPNNPARGLSCYDADTLKTLWVRPDLYHSTPAPVLIDVTGDGKLEVIGNNILNNGACVVNATTGKDVYNWIGKKINNHAKGTVWDVDYDGHVELISAWGYSDNPSCTKDFTVLDLVTGNIDYRASEINNWITYPPTVGDVDGDGYVEILAATSTELGHGEVGQGMLYIYNRYFKILQIINDYPYGEQLWEPYCVDCDEDGYNEVLIGSHKGNIWCYDTLGKRPNPAPKAWSAWYSTYRQGAYAAQTAPQATTPSSRIFSDGFESGSFNAWSGTAVTSGETATVVTSRRHHGSYSAKFTTNGGGAASSTSENAYVYKSIDVDEVYVRGYFYIENGLPLSDNNDRFYFLRLYGSSIAIAYAGIRKINGADKWTVYLRTDKGGSWTDAVSGPLPQVGKWYCIEIHWKKDPSNGLMELYVDGVKIISVTNVNTAPYGNAKRLDFGIVNAVGVQKSLTVYGDCLVIAKTPIGTE